jgi:rhamnose utilization protein RhaD (predicted bifunctional aldolase and dehydrogenase)/NAD(P)-dependent dehydrogenase (short-subunit alcohol dehydrogenase family)
MENDIRELIEISRFYGQQKQYVIAGGGNTSFKNNDRIWVKASGSSLATITEDGFAMLDRSKLQQISKKIYSSDPFIRESQVKDDLTEANLTRERRPSVETSLHNLLKAPFVVHLHPTLVNGLMCGNNAEQMSSQLFGEKALYIPYIDPGYILFKEVERLVLKYRTEKGAEPEIILLQNHGIFVGAETTGRIKEIYSEVLGKIENSLKGKLVIEPKEVPQQVTEVLPAMRMIASQDGLKILKIRNSSLIKSFTESAEAFSKISKPFTPDIIVYCKSKYLYIDRTDTPESIIDQFRAQYDAFISQNTYAPKVLLIKDFGMVAIGDNAAQTDIILDVFEDMLKISAVSESFGGQHFMTPEQIQFIDTWEVENYRRKVSGGSKKGRLDNKIAIVTGAAQGFGEGITRGMKEEGANVVIADLNEQSGKKTEESFNLMPGSNKALFVKTDVSNIATLQNLIYETVCQFGGLDVFVSNAGILRAGGLDEMNPETFDLVTKINYNAYFYCTKVASKVMMIQNKYAPGYFADIIQINSKSGLSGSKKNFAYAGGKFGGIGLTQSFALELAPNRIKVNSICPGNFYEGPLWADPVNGLFVQYLNAGKVPGAKTIDDVKAFYMNQVPMQRGCTTQDVLKAVLYLIEQEYETGQALPVTGGQIMLN